MPPVGMEVLVCWMQRQLSTWKLIVDGPGAHVSKIWIVVIAVAVEGPIFVVNRGTVVIIVAAVPAVVAIRIMVGHHLVVGSEMLSALV